MRLRRQRVNGTYGQDQIVELCAVYLLLSYVGELLSSPGARTGKQSLDN